MPLTILKYVPGLYVAGNIVGERVADFLIFLKNQRAINTYKDIHLIGFSLGAQYAGDIGFRMQKKTQKKIGRITGIEPGGEN